MINLDLKKYQSIEIHFDGQDLKCITYDFDTDFYTICMFHNEGIEVLSAEGQYYNVTVDDLNEKLSPSK